MADAISPDLLGVREAGDIEAELQQLRLVVARLRENEMKEQQRNDLLEGIISHLPVGLSVQDEYGRFVFVNDAAAASLGILPQGHTNTSSDDTCVSGGSAQEPHSELSAVTKPIEAEERIPSPEGERTWLTRRKPMRILDQTLIVSTSLDITERKRLEGEFVRRVYSDELTGLANRAMIQEH